MTNLFLNHPLAEELKPFARSIAAVPKGGRSGWHGRHCCAGLAAPSRQLAVAPAGVTQLGRLPDAWVPAGLPAAPCQALQCTQRWHTLWPRGTAAWEA